ncbi:vomeronasal type-2 receptor 26-like [Dendropsophus ebraccatus]|uniref:vomeronasal type-2 receptor 26-like n=1 Tax=Dendropsophus ebraccatus TaxID=150705 RepID=UPI003831C174
MTHILPDLVLNDQVGFINGRQAPDNTCRLISILQYCECRNVTATFLTLDAEKAFNRVNWSYAFPALSKYGLEGAIVSSIKALYSNPTAKVFAKGTISDQFTLSNGTRQGCSFSPIFFVLAIEPLAEAIRCQPNIAGITIAQTTHKTALILMTTNPLDSLAMTFQVLADFGNISYYKINNLKPKYSQLTLHQLLYYMKRLRLNMSDGRQLFFDENGDPPAVYDIVNWQLSPEGKLRQVKVGSYDTSITSGDVFTINTSYIQWGTGDHRVPVSVCSPSCPPGFRQAVISGEPLCCFQCIPCSYGEIANHTDSLQCTTCPWDMWPNPTKDHCIPKTEEFLSHEDPLGTTLMAIGISSSLVPVAIFALFICYRTTPIVRANNYFLSCLLLVSLSLCFLCSLVFIGYPQYEMCLLRQVTFGIVFALCVSCILAKTIMVVIAFKATRPGSQLRHWTRPHISYLIVTTCILIQIFLCIMWLTFSPPFLEYKSESNSGVLIIQCNEGSPLAFWSMLGYLGLLASISFIVAFLARRLPDSFNEAKFITFSMLAFLSVWMSYIPASLSSRGEYMVAMEIFAIQSSTWSLVICMFLPKCFIIVFRPDMNSREKLMAKQKNLSN